MIEEKTWDGKTPICEPGIYSGISLEDYHNNLELLDGESVSKSPLQKLVPPDGNPKKFWNYWAHNPNHIEQEPSKEMNFGKAVHALLLGDEVFDEKFTVRPAKINGQDWHSNKTICKEWLAEQKEAGKVVILQTQLEQIKRMADDAQDYELVKLGLLNGRVERSMFYKDPETGIWLKNRPDVIPTDSGMFSDLKATSSLEQDFLERQNGANGYYLAAAMTRMICRNLGMPFESYTLLYSLSKDYGDTDHRDIVEFDLDRGERLIRYCLHKIRHGLDTGEWPGARMYVRHEKPLYMKPWISGAIDDELIMFEKEMAE